jgi:two-component system response regulator YesN
MHILVADDEPVIVRGIAKMVHQFEPAAGRVTTANNGLSALAQIRASEPDVVFTDIRMPKMDGLQLCRTLHEEYPHIQIVVISGYNDFSYAQQCVSYGVKHYLLKPATRNDVHEVLEKLAQRRMPGYVAPSRYVEWVELMEQSVWMMQFDELEDLLRRWSIHCMSLNVSLGVMTELLEDCFQSIVKRLQQKGFPTSARPEFAQSHSVVEALEKFGDTLLAVRSELLLMRSGNYRDPMEEAKAYIDNRLAENLSLEQVAAMVGLTPTYFSALFKKMTSETFVKYRINKRIDRARELLAIPHYRIIDIAGEVGYEDYPHFTKTFKKFVGMTPSEYRAGLGIR